MAKYLVSAVVIAFFSALPSRAYLSGMLFTRTLGTMRQNVGLGVVTSPVMDAMAPGDQRGDSMSETDPAPLAKERDDNVRAAGKVKRQRWINEVKAGDKIIGYVKDTTNFAAFVDVGVVRRGAKSKVIPVTGFLHQSEVIPPYALVNTKRAESCEIEVKKGIHLTTFVKDVFPNAGRMTLSLDPTMDKQKVLKKRSVKRQQSHSARRERRAEKGSIPGAGEVTEGYVRQVQESMLLLDVMHPQLSELRVADICRVTGEDCVDLRKEVKPGNRITVRIDNVVSTRRKSDEKAIVEFVGWGSGRERSEEEQKV